MLEEQKRIEVDRTDLELEFPGELGTPVSGVDGNVSFFDTYYGHQRGLRFSIYRYSVLNFFSFFLDPVTTR